MCYAVPRPVQPSNMSYGTTTSVHCISPGNVSYAQQPVYFSWQCVMRYHNQCISPGNVSYGTTISVFHLAMCHTVPLPASVFHLAMCHTVSQPVQPSNMSHDTTTSVFHLAMCHAVPRPVQPSNMSYDTTTSVFHLVIQYHDQCISPDNVLCGTITSVFQLAMCHTIPRPVYFTW
jgi:hypothetical protein